uniref:Galactose oxidase-like Early set domain-containing protein n=1 Tax=Grammatophora oceanica TaxID=210454 RepID=A0A7S1VAN9_9STRA
MSKPRNYHSVALLMKDGRVWSGGGGLCGDCMNRDGTSANHPDYEILTPPYLLQSDGSPATRPNILSAPSRIGPLDTIIHVQVDTSEYHSFSLVRLGAVTHATNTDNRRIPLRDSTQAGSLFKLSIPSNPNIMVPGIYYLFAMNADGVPSVAESIIVESADSAVNTAPVVSQIISEVTNSLCVETSNQTVEVTPSDCNPTPALFSMGQSDCTSESRHYFTFEPVGDDYRIREGSTGTCLQVGSGSTEDGADVVAGKCCDEPHMLWSVSGAGSTMKLMAQHSGMCLAVESNGLVQQACNLGVGMPNSNDSWRLDNRLSS